MPLHFAVLLASSLVLLSGCGGARSLSIARTATSPTEPLVLPTFEPEPAPVFASPIFRPIHRYYHVGMRKHLLTVNPPEVAELQGWNYEGVGLYLYAEAFGTCSRAIYRCYASSANDHFASPSPECEGYSNLGLLGYACAQPDGEMNGEVSRYYHGGNSDHILTGAEEGVPLARAHGWVKESQITFVFVRLK